MSTTYPSDLSDAEWACLQRFPPPRSPHGRPPSPLPPHRPQRDLLSPAHRLCLAVPAHVLENARESYRSRERRRLSSPWARRTRRTRMNSHYALALPLATTPVAATT